MSSCVKFLFLRKLYYYQSIKYERDARYDILSKRRVRQRIKKYD